MNQLLLSLMGLLKKRFGLRLGAADGAAFVEHERLGAKSATSAAAKQMRGNPANGQTTNETDNPGE
jgi:hypothetical protein